MAHIRERRFVDEVKLENRYLRSLREYQIGEADIYGNVRIKAYPDGLCSVMYADKAIFRRRGWEASESRPEPPDAAMSDYLEHRAAFGEDWEELPEFFRNFWDEQEMNRKRSMRRARSAVYDICHCTSFKWFVTFTLSPDEVDRYDFDTIYRRLRTWLHNNVQRRGLAYVIIPERHKDGAIHFHGFLNDALDRDMVFSNHYDNNGREIYNLERWGYGFTTCVKLDSNYEAAIKYVLKYITKQGEKIGGRWYYSGGPLYDLGRPDVKVLSVPAEIVLALVDGVEGGPIIALDVNIWSVVYCIGELSLQFLESNFRPLGRVPGGSPRQQWRALEAENRRMEELF